MSYSSVSARPSLVEPKTPEESKPSDHLEIRVREYALTFSGVPDSSVWEKRTPPTNDQITILRQHLEVTKEALMSALQECSWDDGSVQEIACRGMKIAFAMVLFTLDEKPTDENSYASKAYEAGIEFYKTHIATQPAEEWRLFSEDSKNAQLKECRLLYNALVEKLNRALPSPSKFTLHEHQGQQLSPSRASPNVLAGIKV